MCLWKMSPYLSISRCKNITLSVTWIIYSLNKIVTTQTFSFAPCVTNDIRTSLVSPSIRKFTIMKTYDLPRKKNIVVSGSLTAFWKTFFRFNERTAKTNACNSEMSILVIKLTVNMLLYILVKLATLVEGDTKAAFSIATTPRCS